MNVYVVTSGCYSDYCIEKVFREQQKAMEYIKENEKDSLNEGQFEIEIYKLEE